jgi:glycine/D-amino acid oxidase-like deaminating enzyme
VSGEGEFSRTLTALETRGPFLANDIFAELRPDSCRASPGGEADEWSASRTMSPSRKLLFGRHLPIAVAFMVTDGLGYDGLGYSPGTQDTISDPSAHQATN